MFKMIRKLFLNVCIFLDNSTRDSELQKLQNELTRLKEVEKAFAVQKRELDQLSEKLSAQQQNNHVDENNKIEIKNLQNALDSSKKEQEGQKGLVTELKKTVEELNKQLADSKQSSLKKDENDSAVRIIELSQHKMKSFYWILSNIFRPPTKSLPWLPHTRRTCWQRMLSSASARSKSKIYAPPRSSLTSKLKSKRRKIMWVLDAISVVRMTVGLSFISLKLFDLRN